MLVAGAAAALGIGALVWSVFPRDASQPVVREGLVWRPAPGEYAGSEACRSCHLKQFTQHQGSAHAQTLHRVLPDAPPLERATGQVVRDPVNGAEYRVEHAEGRHRLRLTLGGQEATANVEWEFGSGRHAHGYLLKLEDGSLVDCRLNWYQDVQGWDFASGQEKPTRRLLEQPLGRPLPPSEIARCFSCHSTQLRATGATREGVSGEKIQVNLDRLELSVGCEACHGPRQQHITEFRSGRGKRDVPPMSAAGMNALCANCHSRMDLTMKSEVISRFQPWGLERSRCYLQSQGRLSCATCHNPHENASHDPAFYEEKCRSCHSRSPDPHGAAAPECPKNPRTGCVGCHMPRDNKSMSHIAFTDHRIRIVEMKRLAEGRP